MNKKIKITLKTALFLVIFYILCMGVAFLIRDDQGSYARVMLHELYEQDNIDILYCGASHVSHGITAKVADKMTGKNNFSTGTAGQTIQGTYAILKQALKLYKIEKVFCELDFGVAIQAPVKQRSGFKADYLISTYIKDPLIKSEYMLSLSLPRFYINSFLPIGKDKYMTFQPKALVQRFKSMISGEYFNYVYSDDEDEYDGKGCLLDLRHVKNGTLCSTVWEGRIPMHAISKDWADMIDKIISLCREHDAELIFYSQPCTDFYLHELGNYDEYYNFAKNFCAERGFEYYDFNLAKEKYQLLEDSDFRDDNHFSKQGVYKWTKIFWDYFGSDRPKEEMFHNSYAEKIALQPDKIYGLVLITSKDNRSVRVTPVANHVDNARITYDVYEENENSKNLLIQGKNIDSVELPAGKSGNLRVVSYLDGIQQNDCEIHFNTTF